MRNGHCRVLLDATAPDRNVELTRAGGSIIFRFQQSVASPERKLTMTSAAKDTTDLPFTLPALLRRQAALHGDRIFMAVDGERISYAQVESRSRLLARGLLASGV